MRKRITDPMNVQDLERVHATGFDLEDVKVTFNHDVKIKVSDIDIEGKQGEMANIPRWVAKVLEKENHVSVQDTDMVVELKQAIVKENVQGEFELATLDSHFYIKLKSYMKTLERSDFDKVESMLNSLVRKRKGKIIHLADSSKLTTDMKKKLTIEEVEYYNNLHNISVDFTKQILGEQD
jgi:DNA replication factor GINS